MRKPIKWTLEACKAEALKYKTRTAFSVGSRTAYGVALKAGWLDVVCAHMSRVLRPAGYYTEEVMRAEVAKFTSFKKLQEEDNALYQAIRIRGLVEELCGHLTRGKKPDGYWGKERCREEALKWGNVTDFKRHAGSAYQKCSEMGWGEEVYGDLEFQSMPTGYWTKERVLEEAKLYKHRLDFKHGSNGAYCASLRDGYSDEAMAHMEDRRTSDSDTVYVWEAEGVQFNGLPVYKIGITSARRGDERVRDCARSGKLTAKLLMLRYVGCRYALTLENHLHTFGVNPLLDVPDGRTEFRALTGEELRVIINIIESHPIHI
jgi:hypothetical protein